MSVSDLAPGQSLARLPDADPDDFVVFFSQRMPAPHGAQTKAHGASSDPGPCQQVQLPSDLGPSRRSTVGFES